MVCMGVPGAVVNERRPHSKSCVGMWCQGDVAVVEANGDRSLFLLSPRRICLRLIFHSGTDHGFGCDLGAID